MARDVVIVALVAAVTAMAVGVAASANIAGEVKSRGVDLVLPIGTFHVALTGSGPATVRLPATASKAIADLPFTIGACAVAASGLVALLLFTKGRSS